MCITNVILAIYIDDALIFSMADNSIFGWINPKNLIPAFFFNGVICGIGGTIGTTFAIKYFSLNFVTNLILLRPVFSQIVGVMIGMDNIPGMMTFLGVGGISVAIVLSRKGEQLRI